MCIKFLKIEQETNSLTEARKIWRKYKSIWKKDTVVVKFYFKKSLISIIPFYSKVLFL